MSTSTHGVTRKCNSCSNPAMLGKTRCSACDARRKQRRLASIAAGECAIDGCHNEPLPGKTKCQSCTNKRSRYDKHVRKERITAGLCAECGREKEADTKLCRACKKKYLKLAHEKNFGGNRRAVLERDSHQCLLCRKTNVVVHHINGDDKINTLDNLATLCRRCHVDIHRLGHNDRIVARELLICPGEQKPQSRQKLAGWKPIRKAVLERDQSRCQICKDKQVKMVIHHKDDNGLTSAKPNNNTDNLITLCQACHVAITNQRNNPNRQLAARYVLALGAGVLATPVAGYSSSRSVASAIKTLAPLSAKGANTNQAGKLITSKRE